MPSFTLCVFLTALTVGPTLAADVTEIDYVVELLVVVDAPMLEKWIDQPGCGSRERVLEEINSLLYEANIIYESLLYYDISIELRLKEVMFPNTSIIPTGILTDGDGVVVDSDTALYWFHQWILAQDIKDYDHGIFFTAADLATQGYTEVAGIAYLDKMCKRKSLSVNEGSLVYTHALVLAHELGHTFGEGHDDMNDPNCGNYYVMTAALIEGAPNRYNFSSCSAEKFKKKLDKLKNGDCLAETSVTEKVVSPRMGELLTADQFCQRFWGKQLYPYSAQEGDDICTVLYCWDGRYTTRQSTTAEGLPCGDGKRCFWGKCVSSDF